MKWGVRRANPGVPSPVSVSSVPGRRVKTAGGTGQGPSADAVRTAITRQTAKKSTTDALSTKDLQDLVTRMNLERQYNTLRPRSPADQARRFVAQTMLGIGKEQAGRIARDQASSQIGELLKKTK
jgi:hypothetical protein